MATTGGNGALGRGSVCSVQMPDGSVMAIGGLTSDAASAPPHSDDSTVIITSDSKGGAIGIGGPKLPVPRYEHACTALLDGTVLVTGGVNEQNSMREVLSDAWIYQPAPAD